MMVELEAGCVSELTLMSGYPFSRYLLTMASSSTAIFALFIMSLFLIDIVSKSSVRRIPELPIKLILLTMGRSVTVKRIIISFPV